MKAFNENRFQEYSAFYRKTPCPQCDKFNWIYDSHSLRSYPDTVDACVCWNCHHIFWTGSKEDFYDQFGPDIEEITGELNEEEFLLEKCNYTTGLEKPHD